MKDALQKLSRMAPRNGTAGPRKRRPLSAAQKAALVAALAGRLQFYPRGYAASKTGPFHSRRAVLSLARAGLLSFSATMRYAAATARAREIYSDTEAGDAAEQVERLEAKRRAPRRGQMSEGAARDDGA
ncbi:hypothetical protein ACFFWD_06390 [Bradyrhizobium erythrophlei]|uniref:hypothetical protein n=1 Tax=Bradyrhizobium erythrophlei TaxID=1437360 RepID=UPI0035EAEE70